MFSRIIPRQHFVDIFPIEVSVSCWVTIQMHTNSIQLRTGAVVSLESKVHTNARLHSVHAQRNINSRVPADGHPHKYA